MWWNRTPFREPFPQPPTSVREWRGAAHGRRLRRRLDRLRRRPVRGLTGHRQYHSYLCDEVVPWVDRSYRTTPRQPSAAIQGKVERRVRRHDHADAASRPLRGVRHPCRRLPVRTDATSPSSARRSGTCATTTATSARGGRTSSRTSFTKEGDHDLLMLLGVSACFSARPDGTSSFRSTRGPECSAPRSGQRWLDWDPVRMVPKYAAQLRSLRAVWIDAGVRDEWYLDVGAQPCTSRCWPGRRPDRRDPVRAVRGQPHGHRLPVPALAGLALPANG